MAQVSKRTVYKYFPGKEDLYQVTTHKLVLRVHYWNDGSYSKSQRLRPQLIRIAILEVKAMGVFLGKTYRMRIATPHGFWVGTIYFLWLRMVSR